MPTYEGVRLKALEFDRKLFCNSRRRELKNKEFTIISNNCWGGEVYEYYNLQKQSPTVGLFFMATDYIKLLKRITAYTCADLSFISPDQSRWKSCGQIMNDRRFGSYPIGVLSVGDEDIEVFFLHYKSAEEARMKWERRCRRINPDKLLVKFNDQNGCTEEHIKEYLELEFPHKAFFTCKYWPGLSETMSRYSQEGKLYYRVIRQFPRHEQIMASYEPFGKDVTAMLNSL